MRLRITSGSPLRGQICVAADKSISHRAVMLGAIASGSSRISNLLMGEDVLATIDAFRKMGVTIEQTDKSDKSEIVIHGVGLHGLKKPDTPLNMGNSGTALRLLAGLLCGQSWQSELDGDASLRVRPMGRIIKPLGMMGARIDSNDDKPPLIINANPDSASTTQLKGITYEMPIASAQVKSCLLLAGLYAKGATTVVEPGPSRDHTERMLKAFGVKVIAEKGEVCLTESNDERKLYACDIRVPADLSSAAFFMVGASIIRGSDVLLKNVGINPSRFGVLSILKKMGADIELVNHASAGGEPLADIQVRSAELHACRIDGDEIALAIDEIPAIAIAAACAQGTTEIRDAAELRVKESDRISSTAAGLTAMGVSVTEHADGLTIVGKGGESLNGATVDSQTDHRIAMAFAMAGGVAEGEVEIANCENIVTSFPEFCQVANTAGLDIQISN